MTHLTTKVQFPIYGPIWIIFFLWLGNLMGIPNPILYFPQMTLWTTKVQFLVYGPIWIIFSFDLEIRLGFQIFMICTKNNSSLMPEKIGFGGLWGAGQNEYFFREPFTCPYKYFCSWHFHTNFKQKQIKIWINLSSGFV